MDSVDYRQLFGSARDAVIVADEAGRVLEINPAVEDLLGWRAEELSGQSLTTIMPERYRSAHERGLSRMVATGVPTLIGKTVQVEALHKDGREVHIELALTALRSSTGARQFAAVIRDLSVVRRLEQAVEQERERARRLDDAVQMRDEFLSVASHELRAPLSVLKMQAQLAAHAGLPGDAAARLARQVDRLEKLVQRMFDTSRVATSRLDLALEDVDLVGLVRHAAHDLSLLAPAHAITVRTPPEPIVVRADRGRLEEVIVNLLDNAVKYSPEPAPIVVDLSVGQGAVRCAVIDQGMGVPVDLRERLFTRFARESSERVRSIAGLGVGLYISRGIIEAHGGRLELADADGQGAAFCFELSLAGGVPSSGGRVLVVDDDADLLDLVQLALEHADIPAVGARDRAEALEVMRRERPVLVLLDLMMPRMDGWECFRRMRADERLSGIPVIVVSGDHDLKKKAGQMGVPAWLPKPVDVDAMLSMVRRHLPPAA